jgi:3-oxoacyl-[acyl-carrier-protein] synthase II
VVITGLGAVGSWGAGADLLREALAAGRPALSEVDRSAGYHRAGGARRAALVPPGALAGWLSPGEGRRMSFPSKLAVAAARMALGCAELDAESVREARAAAVVLATTFGPSSTSEELLTQILFDSPEAASPALFTESVANAPAAQIAILLGARGPSVTICQREAGALQAAAKAVAEVASGRSELALAGAVEEMTPLLHALLDRYGVLARPLGRSENGGPDAGEELARPFDRRRNGVLGAESAAVLVVESEESARARGARPLARVAAAASAFDPSAAPAGWGTGHAGLAARLRRLLESRSPGGVGGIDRIVSGASGARQADRLESAVLRELWPGLGADRRPPVLAPKSVTGEYGGGFLAAAVLAAAGAPFGPVAGFGEPDPELGVVPHDGARLAAPSRVLVTSLAAGGAATWLVLEAP